MSETDVRIFPLGDSALTIEFGNTVSTALNKKAIDLSNYFEQSQFPGFVESVPGYASTTVFYDIVKVRKHFHDFPTAFEAVKNLAIAAIDGLAASQKGGSLIVEIPVYFDAKSAPDLVLVAKTNGLSPQAVIEIFTAATYRVFMLGFLPGFSYMGEVDDRLAMPRKDSPRIVVPAGSVGIVGKQTGIYSLASPGGWQIIGRTDAQMFTPDAATPCLLQPGDEVRFVAVK